MRFYAAASTDAVQVIGRELNITYVVLGISLAALAIAWVLRGQVLAASEGTAKMIEIAEAVQEGAAAYLKRQFTTLSYFVGIVFFLLFALPAEDLSIKIGRSLFFLMGAAFSALVGYNGMWLAVRANVRVAEAARQGSATDAVTIAFRTGGVVGMTTVGLGLIGAAGAVALFKADAPTVLEGFGFGAAMLAMFMRVGGGIFTKAADVGADLVGKVEKNIPEDDPRNPATIADNVGDNVGDCAGMAADLFESYAVTLVAALILGKAAFGVEGLIYPLIVPAIGIVTAVIGIFLTRLRSTDKSAMTAINRSFFLSAIISAVLVGLATYTYLPTSLTGLTVPAEGEILASGVNPQVLTFGAVLIGIALAAAIQVLTGFFTEVGRRPVNDVAASSQTGAATVLLAGISVGFESAVYSAILIASAVFGAFLLGGGSIVLSLFAIAIAGTGLLTTVGVIVAMDTFGPISDNAQGIAEMSGDVKGEGAKILTSLDAVGNTTKAITKGIAIATAVLAATALFGAFTDAIKTAVNEAVTVGTEVAPQFKGILDVADPRNLVGLIIGAAVVFLFSGLAINAVSRAAGAVVMEVRNQFKLHPGIMNGTQKPEYGRVVDICTRDSLRELVTPGILAVMAPIAVGFGLGVGALGAYLAGAIGTGTLMAVFLSNSGGAWDNAKKMVEDGNYGGKGSEAHAATIIGDTVGDPFKDTAGPAINPLIKVMNLVGLLITPAIVGFALPTQSSASIAIALVATAFIIAALIRNRRQSTSIEY
jgi:K(+)-stimulated pyrophosphate-energized sodium pump